MIRVKLCEKPKQRKKLRFTEDELPVKKRQTSTSRLKRTQIKEVTFIQGGSSKLSTQVFRINAKKTKNAHIRQLWF